MDPRTLQFYGGHAADLTQRYAAAPSVASRFFPAAFTPGSRVLDVGCGSGRDLKALIDAGYEAAGVDACDDMLREAKAPVPDTDAEVKHRHSAESLEHSRRLI